MMSMLLGLAVLSGAVLFESPADQIYRLECSGGRCSTPPPRFGDETWSAYRVEVEILPEEGFAGLDFHVQDDGSGGANVHFLASEAGIQPAGVWGSATAWKLWPYSAAPRPIASGEWLRLRVDVGEDLANIYIDGGKTPVVTFTALPFARGGVRPWAYAGIASFRKLRVTALEPGSVKPLAQDPWAVFNHPKVVRRWQVSDSSEQEWITAETDPRGVLNLTALFPRANFEHVAFAKTVLHSDAAATRKAYVTYTDRFKLWCNDRLVFEGKPRGWFDPDREKLGNSRLVLDQFEIELPLQKGANVVRVRSETTEPFGWGFWMRTD